MRHPQHFKTRHRHNISHWSGAVVPVLPLCSETAHLLFFLSATKQRQTNFYKLNQWLFKGDVWIVFGQDTLCSHTHSTTSCLSSLESSIRKQCITEQNEHETSWDQIRQVVLLIKRYVHICTSLTFKKKDAVLRQIWKKREPVLKALLPVHLQYPQYQSPQTVFTVTPEVEN